MTLWTLTFGCSYVVLYPYNFHEFSPSHCATVNSLTVVCIVWPGKRMVLANCVFFRTTRWNLELYNAMNPVPDVSTKVPLQRKSFFPRKTARSHKFLRDFVALNFCSIEKPQALSIATCSNDGMFEALL